MAALYIKGCSLSISAFPGDIATLSTAISAKLTCSDVSATVIELFFLSVSFKLSRISLAVAFTICVPGVATHV